MLEKMVLNIFGEGATVKELPREHHQRPGALEAITGGKRDDLSNMYLTGLGERIYLVRSKHGLDVLGRRIVMSQHGMPERDWATDEILKPWTWNKVPAGHPWHELMETL